MDRVSQPRGFVKPCQRESCCSGRTGVINSRGCYNVLSLPFDLVAVSRFPESRRIPAFEHWLIMRRIRMLSNSRAISPIGKRYNTTSLGQPWRFENLSHFESLFLYPCSLITTYRIIYDLFLSEKLPNTLEKENLFVLSRLISIRRISLRRYRATF